MVYAINWTLLLADIPLFLLTLNSCNKEAFTTIIIVLKINHHEQVKPAVNIVLVS